MITHLVLVFSQQDLNLKLTVPFQAFNLTKQSIHIQMLPVCTYGIL